MCILKILTFLFFLLLGYFLSKFIEYIVKKNKSKNSKKIYLAVTTISNAEFILGFVIVLFSMSQRFINDYIWQITKSRNYVDFGSSTLDFFNNSLLSVLYLIFIVLIVYIFYAKVFPLKLIKHIKTIEVILCFITYLFFISFLNSIDLFGNMFHHWLSLIIILIILLIVYCKAFPKMSGLFNSSNH